MNDGYEETYDEYCDRKDLHEEAESTAWLRSRGALVLLPGDASPLGELIRAVFSESGGEYYLRHFYDMDIIEAALELRKDPNVKDWAERGR